MSAMLDLFDAPTIPGLSVRHDVISGTEETALIARISSIDLSPFRFQQWTGKRLTRSFGWSYDFENGRFARADPIPGWFLPIRQRAAHAFGLDADDLVQALLIRYDPGAGIGWHRDRPVFGTVIGLSLGAPATMRFRRRVGTRFERGATALERRSFYHLSGEIRHDWEHSIAAIDETRWSVTFRTLAHRDHDASFR